MWIHRLHGVGRGVLAWISDGSALSGLLTVVYCTVVSCVVRRPTHIVIESYIVYFFYVILVLVVIQLKGLKLFLAVIAVTVSVSLSESPQARRLSRKQ